MQFNSGSGSELNSEINITPLVDVVLVLLIIFMVVVPMLLQGYDVNIPKASAQTVPTEAESSQVILNITPATCEVLLPPPGDNGLPADCRVSLDEQETPVKDLSVRVAEIMSDRPPEQHVLFLVAEDRVNYEAVLRIVDLAKSGVDDLRIEFVTD